MAAVDAEVDLPPVIDSRPMGVAWVADQLWQRLGITQSCAYTIPRCGPATDR